MKIGKIFADGIEGHANLKKELGVKGRLNAFQGLGFCWRFQSTPSLKVF